MEHEIALFTAFVPNPRRQRYLGLLQHPADRKKLLRYLAHFHDLDPRYCRRVAPDQQTPDALLALLRARKAPDTCHVISEGREVDGADMPLKEALDHVVGMALGTFISCIPGRLAYFEGEEPGERYVLERKE